MHFTTALVAGLVASTSAFLIPPQVSDIVKDTRFDEAPKHFKDLIHSLLEAKPEVLDLDCPSCPAAHLSERLGEADLGVWSPDERAIRLEFTTQDNALQFNGQTIFPLQEVAKAHNPVTISAQQVDKASGKLSIAEQISFVVEALPAMQDGAPFEMIPVDITVLAYAGSPVEVETISLKLIKPHDGSLTIAKVDRIPFEVTPGAQSCHNSSSWSLCRIKAMIAARLRQITEAAQHSANRVHGWMGKPKGCGHGRYNGVFRPHDVHGGVPKFQDRPGHPGHPGPHHAGHRHHSHHRFAHFVRTAFRFVIVPALLGVVGGLMASAIGMLVGRAIVYLWYRTYRRSQRPIQLRVEEVVIIDGEKDGLLVEEVLPAYQDIEAVEIVDEKH